MTERTIFLAPQRCIGCRSCVIACRECDSHIGKAMLFIDYLNRSESMATAPALCMHCQDPVAPCAQVCPTQAILVSRDGVVQQANKERCIACRNCAYACPFGIPKIDLADRLQYKCNMCYDRVAVGKKPMCATVCPSGAIAFGTYEEIAAQNRGVPVNRFRFGNQMVQTGVYVMAPAGVEVFHIQQALKFAGGAEISAVPGIYKGEVWR
ncbi:MAG: 4Fe-4S binding protein [Chloroflexi bacterium]|nr:4Fe-4S binding protein [Chloroflexota bacterium]